MGHRLRGVAIGVKFVLVLGLSAGWAQGEEPKDRGRPAEVQRILEQEKEREEAQRRQKELATGGILLRKGQLEVEPSFTYGFSSNNNLSIEGFALQPIFVVGLIRSERVRRHVLVPALSVSYGLVDSAQVEAEVPYRYRSDEFTFSDNQQKHAHKFGVGDLRVGAAVQLHRQGKGDIPDLIGHFNLFIPTGNDPFSYDAANPVDKNVPLGSGLWSLGAGLTAITASDPAILFGSVSTIYSFPRDAEGTVIRGRVTPGASVGYSLGLALALNYQLTLNFQFQHAFTRSSDLDGVRLANSSVNDARFLIGVAWAYSSTRRLHVSVGTGLTEDAPDLIIRISMPIKFF